MAKIIDPILPILSIFGYRAIILGSFGGSGKPKPLHKRGSYMLLLRSSKSGHPGNASL